MIRLRPFACGAALLTFASVPAAATPFHYSLFGTDVHGTGESEYASFYIDSQPSILPENGGLNENFRVKFISGIFQHGATVKTLQDVVFFSYDQGGGFGVLDTDVKGSDPNLTFLLNLLGDQLYTGPETAPTLLTGKFTVYDVDSGSPLSLDVSAVSAVPEAATWLTMIAGFGAVGAAARRGRMRVAVRFA